MDRLNKTEIKWIERQMRGNWHRLDEYNIVGDEEEGDDEEVRFYERVVDHAGEERGESISPGEINDYLLHRIIEVNEKDNE